jgi:hypothetical protein
MSNVEGQQSQEPVAPILHTENAQEAVVQEAAATDEAVEAAPSTEQPAAPIALTENAPEAVGQQAASTTEVEAAQPAEVGPEQQAAD